LSFRGTFEHALDAKHRLTVPSKFRAALSDGVVLSVSPEVGEARSLSMWTPEGYDDYVKLSIGQLNPLSPQGRELSRVLHNNSYDTELDSANRVMVPPVLMAYAGLDKEVTVTGSGPCIEIWDRPTYADYNLNALSRFSDMTTGL
jgi:MraZ protein